MAWLDALGSAPQSPSDEMAWPTSNPATYGQGGSPVPSWFTPATERSYFFCINKSLFKEDRRELGILHRWDKKRISPKCWTLETSKKRPVARYFCGKTFRNNRELARTGVELWALALIIDQINLPEAFFLSFFSLCFAAPTITPFTAFPSPKRGISSLVTSRVSWKVMVGNGRVKWSEVAGEKMWKSRVSLFLLLFCSERCVFSFFAFSFSSG